MTTAYNAARNAATATFIESTTFGVEVETYGLTNDRAAAIVAAAIGGTVEHAGGYYDKVVAVGTDGRKWTAMHDGSIVGQGSEIVSPILKGAADLETLQKVVRALREAGAKSDAGHQCGIHVHVGTQGLDVATIGRVVKTAAKYDSFIRTATGVSSSRARWCAPLASDTVARLGRCRDRAALARAWYGERSDAQVSYRVRSHYDSSRYHGLNLHSMFYANRGTVEFRYFDGTMHAGKIKAYVHLCLAIVAKAASTTAASSAPAKHETVQQASNLLIGLRLKGDAFRTARHHLLASWKPARDEKSEAA